MNGTSDEGGIDSDRGGRTDVRVASKSWRLPETPLQPDVARDFLGVCLTQAVAGRGEAVRPFFSTGRVHGRAAGQCRIDSLISHLEPPARTTSRTEYPSQTNWN
jgi:hypothetical protein